MTMTEAKRLKILFVPCSPTLYGVIRGTEFAGFVPEGAELVDHKVAPERGGVLLMVRHPSYESVPEAAVIPEEPWKPKPWVPAKSA